MSGSATAQRRPRPVHWFVVHGVAWTLLFALWPAPRAAYLPLFHAHANAVFGGLDAWSIQLRAPAPDSGLDTDTVMTGSPRSGAGMGWESSFSVTRIGYWPSALLVALILATPLPLSRRAASVLIGLAVVDLFTLARIGVEIAYADYTLAYATNAERGPLHVLLGIGSESLTATIPSAAIVLVCWVLCASPSQTIDLGAARTWIRGRSD